MTTPPAPPPGPSGVNLVSANEAPVDEATKQAMMRSKALAASLGGVVSVLMQSPDYKFNTLADLEWLVGPSLVLQQFALVEAPSAQSNHLLPIAAVLWGMVSPEVDQRLSRELDRPIRLAPAEWRSGNIPWIVVAAGDRNALSPLLQKLAATRFASTPPKIRVRGPEGRVSVGRLELRPTS